MRLLPLCAVLICVSAVWEPSPVVAQKTGVAPELHPWGHFSKGAWRYSRVTTESFDERGAVASTSITETKTTLQDLGADGVTLRLEAAVEVAGKERDGEPQIVKQGFRGESPADKVTVQDLGAAEVTIDGLRIPCKVEQYEATGPQSKSTTKTFYSTTVAPYVLKRQTTTTDLETGAVLTQSSLNVLSLNRPCDVLRRRKRAAHVETVSTYPKGSTVTRAFVSSEIPGGVICHSSEERDTKGRLVRRSTLQLLAYGLDPEEEYSVEFNRVPRRVLKSHRLSSPRD